MSITDYFSKEFECSFCGHIWECKKSKYKIKTLKTVGGKHWKIFITRCPNCGRETTLTTSNEKEGKEEL